MGRLGALVGPGQCPDAVRARPAPTAALLNVELSTLDQQVLTSFALFGSDAAAGLLVSHDETAAGPELVETYGVAEFAPADHMLWTIGDRGFVMTLSPRVPVTLRRVVKGFVEELLAPQGLTASDVAHWLVHPGGPSVLAGAA